MHLAHKHFDQLTTGKLAEMGMYLNPQPVVRQILELSCILTSGAPAANYEQVLK